MIEIIVIILITAWGFAVLTIGIGLAMEDKHGFGNGKEEDNK